MSTPEDLLDALEQISQWTISPLLGGDIPATADGRSITHGPDPRDAEIERLRNELAADKAFYGGLINDLQQESLAYHVGLKERDALMRALQDELRRMAHRTAHMGMTGFYEEMVKDFLPRLERLAGMDLYTLPIQHLPKEKTNAPS